MVAENGPELPFIGDLGRCGAARHSGLSPHQQNLIAGELNAHYLPEWVYYAADSHLSRLPVLTANNSRCSSRH